MNKYLRLPDDIIGLVKQFAMATVPFKDELLKRDFVEYEEGLLEDLSFWNLRTKGSLESYNR